jgi:hypothetical protein
VALDKRAGFVCFVAGWQADLLVYVKGLHGQLEAALLDE